MRARPAAVRPRRFVGPLGALTCVAMLACGCARGRDATGAAPGPKAAPADASAGCAGTPRPAARGERREITVADEPRSYVVDAPTSDHTAPLPLILAFHGFRGNADGLRRGTGMIGLAARAAAVVVHPDGHEGVHLLGTVGRGWDLRADETRDLDFVRTLLDALERERCIDRRRIYATGMSNGGFFANLVGCRLADRVAAVAPVAGAMPLPGCTPPHPIAVLLTFGRADDIVPPTLMRSARDWWATVERCGGGRERDGCTHFEGCAADLVSCEGPQAHSWPPEATERIWRFFEAHPRA